MRLKLVACACLLALVGPALAEDTPSDASWSFSGFGTLGVVATDTDQGEFVIPGQHGGVKTDPGISPDSKLGLQVNGKLDKTFSGTVQVLSKHNGDGNWRPGVEWAFAKAQVTPGIALRAGRMGAPFFAVSDFRDVDFANTWLRAPLEVYGQVSLSHFDGADVIVQHPWGGTTFTAQVFGGKADSVSDMTRVHIAKLTGMNVTAEFDGGITVRAGTAHGRVTAKSATVDGFAAVLSASGFPDIAQQMMADDKAAWFSGVGVSIDRNDWVGSAEYTVRRTDSFIADTTGWAVLAGHRFGAFTPYVVVSKLREDSSNITNSIPTGVPQLAPLYAGVEAVKYSQNQAQRTVALGTRWDAYRNVALKLQVEQIKVGSGVGLFNQAQPGLANSTVNAISVAADFVF
jgi:hypothetical protein